MSRATKRATAFSTISHVGPYAKWMRFTARTYVTEVRRFCAILNQSERRDQELNILALEFKSLFADRRFVALLTSQGFDTVPIALAKAVKRINTDLIAATAATRYRPKISVGAMRLLKDRKLLTSVYGILEKMTPRRQLDSIRQMISANCSTVSHALHLLGQTVPLGVHRQPKKVTVFTPELRKIMVTEAEVLADKVRALTPDYAERRLGLMIAKGYVRAILANVRMGRYLAEHHRYRMRRLRAAASQ